MMGLRMLIVPEALVSMEWVSMKWASSVVVMNLLAKKSVESMSRPKPHTRRAWSMASRHSSPGAMSRSVQA